MTQTQVLLAIFIPLGVLVIAAITFYIFGYIYNNLVSRRRLATNSWRELTKVLKKNFNYIPSIIQSVKMDNKTRDVLKDIFKQYNSMDLLTSSPKEVGSLYKVFVDCLDTLNEGNEGNSVLDFVNESRRLSYFSIPLYNHNVKSYQHFKSLFINRSVANTFRFQDIDLLVVEESDATSTVDVRLKRFDRK